MSAAEPAMISERTAAPEPADADAEARLSAEEVDLLAAAGRLIRGGYLMPAADYALLAALKARASATGAPPDTSELLRAGLHALMQSGRAELRRLLDGLPPCTPRRRRGSRGPRDKKQG